MATPDPRIDRFAPRIPCFTVVTGAGLHRCWATNLSVGGMALMGYVTRPAALQRDDELELELALGCALQPLRVVARVAWVGRARADGRVGFGVQFQPLPGEVVAEVARFIAQHRPHVILVQPTPEEREVALAALGGLDLEVVTEVGALTDTMLHTCASLVAFTHTDASLTALMTTLRALRPDGPATPGEMPLAPVTVYSGLESRVLLPVYSQSLIYDVLRPPLDSRTLRLAVERSCERWTLQVELHWASLQLEGHALALQAAAPAQRTPLLPRYGGGIVRTSAEMCRVYDLIQTVARHEVPVLLTGETGTGKELAAREVHALSRRAHTVFLAQDCGAMTETLLESELFGHVRGAFTGATLDHPGLFQMADGGTIFLDEIQNTSPGLQAKLLRVVEQGEVRPVGAAQPKRVDIRLIAACNVDLRAAVKAGGFRPDFFYRLNRFPIELPPLRAHTADIVPLTEHFLTMVCTAMQRDVPRVDPRVERALLAYAWPGNIRELRNVIERALLLTPLGSPIRWESLPDEVRDTATPACSDAGTLDAQVEAFERRVIQSVLVRNAGVVRRAARELDVNAVTLARKIRRLGLG